jgi:site-specific recombinase XerD
LRVHRSPVKARRIRRRRLPRHRRCGLPRACSKACDSVEGTIRHGRHTFISHALAVGRTLAEVRDAAGHANVSITSGYLHVAVVDEAAVANLFLFEQR